MNQVFLEGRSMTSLEDILTRAVLEAQIIGAKYVRGDIDDDKRKERIAQITEQAFIEFNRNEQELHSEVEVI